MLNCDPTALAQAARCFQCFSDGSQSSLKTFLLCTLATEHPGLPDPPTSLVATGDVSVVNLTIGAPSPPPTVGYVIKWGTTPGGPYPNSKSLPVGGPFQITSASDGLVAGTTYYFIAYSDNGFGLVSSGSSSSASAAPTLSALNTDWLARITAAGGARPAMSTFLANDTFFSSLVSAGLRSSDNTSGKVQAANLFVPDNLTASYTPLIKGGGFDSWTSPGSGGPVNDLTINGLAYGGFVNRFLRTNIFPGNFMTSGSGFGCVYVSVDDANGGEEYGCNETGLNDFRIFCHDPTNSNHTGAYCYEQSNFLDAGLIASPGYFCVSRTTTTQVNIYFANSTNPHASKLSNTTAESHTPSVTRDLFVFGDNNNGSFFHQSTKRLSFVAFGTGLTAADSLALFNAVQAFRTSIGGGYV